MRASAATSGSRSAAVASRRATMASIVSSRRSMRGRSAMATHALAQVVERPQLQLLDGPFRPIEGGRHFANALLLDEAHPDHLPLHVRQPIEVWIQRHPPLDIVELARIRHVGWWLVRSPDVFTPVVGEGVCCDLEQPRRKRYPA